MTLGLIVAALVGGGVLFVQAGAISQRDLGDTTEVAARVLSSPGIPAEVLPQLQKMLNDALGASAAQAQPLGLEFTVSTIATRLGAVLLLIFLVQVLVTMYRYTVRLAAFYDARADTLDLLQHFEKSDIEILSRLLAPDFLDFGKVPASPAQNTFDLAKELLAKR